MSDSIFPLDLFKIRSYNQGWAILVSITKWIKPGYADLYYDGVIDCYSLGFITITYTTNPNLIYTDEEIEKHIEEHRADGDLK